MSTYENYHKTSHVYDKTRTAGGVDIIRSALAEGALPLKEQVLVDAGCGTGLYSDALVNEVRCIEAVDLNAGMLAMAQSKLKAEEKSGRIRFHETKIDSLPLANESVDAVMLNQVLHHLPDDADSGWPEHNKVFTEFFRILKPGGCLIINSCSPEQLKLGFWFYHLIPDAVQAILEKTICIDTMAKQLQNIGFSEPRQEIPLDLTLQDEAYFRSDGVLDSDWRRGDSIWSLVSAESLSEVLEKVEVLQSTGKLESFMLQNDMPRKTSGQVTFTVARKQV